MIEHIDSDPTPPHGTIRPGDLAPWQYTVIFLAVCGLIAGLILSWPALWTTAL